MHVVWVGKSMRMGNGFGEIGEQSVEEEKLNKRERSSSFSLTTVCDNKIYVISVALLLHKILGLALGHKRSSWRSLRGKTESKKVQKM